MKLIKIINETKFGGEAEFKLTRKEAQRYMQAQDDLMAVFYSSIEPGISKEFHEQFKKTQEDIEIPEGKLLGAWPREIKLLDDNTYRGYFQFAKKVSR